MKHMYICIKSTCTREIASCRKGIMFQIMRNFLMQKYFNNFTKAYATREI